MGLRSIADIRAAIEAGRFERVIRGWYATPATDREAIAAMRLGGRLGCVSSLRLHGAWLPPDTGMHLEFPSHASGRRLAIKNLPSGAVAHWHGKAAGTGSVEPVVPIERAVAQMLACQPAHFIVAIGDSLLHRDLITRNRLRAIFLNAPVRVHDLIDHIDGRSEEGIESVVRYRLALAGIVATVQVRIGMHRVDLIIDGWLVIEIDGRATHAQHEAFTRDRVRTATLMRGGHVVLQFGYATVMYDWPFVRATIQDVMAQHAPIH